MEDHPSREILIRRIANLEDQLKARRKGQYDSCSSEAFGLADFEHAADGICVCHAIDDFPFVRFTFWNRRMVELSGYDREQINRKGWYQSVYPDPDVQAEAISRMAKMRKGVNLEAETWEITRADGEKRNLRISTSTLDDGDGTPRVMAIMHDVTELKCAEEALRKEKQDLKLEVARQSKSLVDAEQALKTSSAQYRMLFEIAGDALFIENDRDEILDVNKQACDLLGYSREELLSMKVYDIQAPEYRGEPGRVLSREIVDHQGKPFETMDLHKDGTPIPVEVANNRLEEAGLYLTIVRDIRERKSAEQSRRETFDIIEKSPVAAFLWRNETDWPVEFVTRNVGHIFGYSDTDFLSGRILFSKVVHPDDMERVAHEVATNSQEPGRTAFVHEPYRIVAADGTVRWVNDQTFIRRDHTGTITHFQGIVEDITTRVVAEQALRESEAKFSRVFQMNPDTVFITRLEDGVILDVNDSFSKATGYSREEVVGRNSVTELHLWTDPKERRKYVGEILRKGAARDMELYFRVKNGSLRLGSVCGAMIEISGERCILGTIRDITEERQAANQLAAEKERLAVTVRSIGDAVITTNREGRIALMNPIAEDLTGCIEAGAIGRPLMDVFRIVNGRTGEPCANPVDRVLSTGQIVGLANHTILMARDGRERIIADSGAPILDLQGEIIGVVLVFRDISGQQRIEEELLKMEKLKSLGVLAGGIAHDFNNFLTGIIGNLSLAKLDVQPGNPVSRALDEMEKAAVRAKDLTHQLLTFSKGGEPVKHTTNIGDLVRESAQFALHGSNVRCTFSIDEGLLPADVDDGQIAQVVHNLIINVDQAMPNGGTVLIQGTNVILFLDNPYALKPGKHIQLSIQDEGTGIHPEHLKKIFDPYFTTKQKGSGLGLAVAYSIIAKHDGQLTVDSKFGHGTTFTILLPASEGTHVIDTRKTESLLAGHGRILVMDDEDFIRELVSVMLPKMGYDVVLAQDGQAAVDIYKEALSAGNPFDAVILDLTVPGGMGGKETVRQLRALDPNVRAIVSSGYSNDPVMANYARYGFCGAVKKPYLIQDMSQLLNAVIKA
ncbi:PAS domain S-box protein [Desulfosarcina sp.]|uniref:PAS domain S-box protein n=1 Tax=Desulfosarcina sp. TaxID=2027861 RepID=UPI0029A77C34|nr:PAS domain S-box protein [Desulfosarcina sp.]MDX2453575.1 PAS domain S-box protein [Desulfosarcina sp.]MDX2491282.1 PAS domain S-box protein [Desulfosarcina sp.]